MPNAKSAISARMMSAASPIPSERPARRRREPKPRAVVRTAGLPPADRPRRLTARTRSIRLVAAVALGVVIVRAVTVAVSVTIGLRSRLVPASPSGGDGVGIFPSRFGLAATQLVHEVVEEVAHAR